MNVTPSSTDGHSFQCFVCEVSLPSNRLTALQHVATEHPDFFHGLVIPEYPSDSDSQMTPPNSTHADTVSISIILLAVLSCYYSSDVGILTCNDSWSNYYTSHPLSAHDKDGEYLTVRTY